MTLSILGGLVMTAVALGLFAAFAQNPWAALVLTFVVGVSATAMIPALQTRLMDVADDAQTLAAALNHSALNIANAAGAYLGGVVVGAGLGYRSPSALGVILAGAGMVVLGLAVLTARRAKNAQPTSGGVETDLER